MSTPKLKNQSQHKKRTNVTIAIDYDDGSYESYVIKNPGVISEMTESYFGKDYNHTVLSIEGLPDEKGFTYYKMMVNVPEKASLK